MLPVIELFTSLQGESSYAGQRCFFIRLSGCNLRCSYCDTGYAWHGGELRSVSELVDEAEKSNCRLVELTGGEPLIHDETPELAQQLLSAGFEVMIETNGSLDIGRVSEKCKRIVDCKLPASGMFEHNLSSNWTKLTAYDEVKFVVSSRSDFDCAIREIVKYDLEKRTPNLIISPVWGNVKFDDLAAWVIESGRNIRLQLQMHKLIWGDRKGV